MNRRSFLLSLPLLPYVAKALTVIEAAPVTVTGVVEYVVNTTVERYDDTLDVSRVDVFDRYEYSWKTLGTFQKNNV
jgi:hypothetical protein